METPIVGPRALEPMLGRVRLVDCRPHTEWAEGHLAGAVNADLELHLSSPGDPECGGRHPLPEFRDWCRKLGEWGIDPQTPVVAYDASGGANAACRFWWMMRGVGHQEVAVLDGGLEAAKEAGIEVVAETPDVVARATYPVEDGAGWDHMSVSAEEVDVRRSDPDACLIDVRAEARYRGEADPYDPNPGHIPGALNWHYETNLDTRGRWRPTLELRADYERLLDGRSSENTIVYCGSGVTACHSLLALEAAGLAGAKLYVGSWSEWGRSDRPKATVVG